MAKLNIIVKILDYWIEDTYTYNGYKVYILMEVGNKLKLIEKYLNDIEK